MQWLIEHMRLIDPAPEWTGLPDENDAKLIKALQDKGRTYKEIKQIPFTETLIGFDDVDLSIPTAVYGSCQIIEKISKQYLQINTFWHKDLFNPLHLVGTSFNMLNQYMNLTNVGSLRDHWVAEPMFIKSLRIKALNGMVIEPDKSDRDNWLIEHSELDRNELLILSNVQKIDREWRFFIIDGKIITGSTYRVDGRRNTRHPISQTTWNEVESIASKLPAVDNTVVMDLCRLRDGSHKIVELNCLSSSGFYNSDMDKLIDAWEEYVTRKAESGLETSNAG